MTEFGLPEVMSPDLFRDQLYTAIHNLDNTRVKLLVESYRPNLNDVHVKPYPFLIFAVLKENLGAVQYLLSQGADVNMIMPSDPAYSGPDTPFLMALRMDFGDIALFLLQNNADHTRLDADQNNTLLKAFKANNWRLIRFMYKHNKYCDPKAKNRHGDSFFNLVLEIRTHLAEKLPVDLHDPAMWVHQQHTFVDKLLQWSVDPIL